MNPSLRPPTPTTCPLCHTSLAVGLLATTGTDTAHFRCASDFLRRALPSQDARRGR